MGEILIIPTSQYSSSCQRKVTAGIQLGQARHGLTLVIDVAVAIHKPSLLGYGRAGSAPAAEHSSWVVAQSPPAAAGRMASPSESW